MKKTLSFIGIFALCAGSVVSLSGCIQTPNWTLFYVADQQEIPSNMLQRQYIAGYYSTLDQCQAKGNGLLKLAASNMAPELAFTCAELCETDEASGIIQCQNQVAGSRDDGF